MEDIAKRDQNYVPAIQGVSSLDGISPVDIHVNPATHGVLVDTSSDTFTENISDTVSSIDTKLDNLTVTANAGTGYPQLTVVNAIQATAYSLSGSAYSATSNLPNDYILDHIQFNFSTTQSRNITITSADGTQLWSATGDTSLNITLEDIDKAFNGGDNFTIDVTQTAGACAMDVLATVREGDSTLSISTHTINVQYADSANLDAFARLRMSNPQTLFDSKQLNDNQPFFWDDAQTSGSGTSSTYNANQASTTMSVGSSTAGVRVRQTFRRFNYQPGKSQLFIQTGIFGAAATGIRRKAGLFDARNGVFFDQQSDGIGVTVRSYTSGSTVDTRVLQSNWNIDKLDGSGASGTTLDFTKTLIWFADFEWLGVGRVRFGFFIDGRPYYCHQVLNANNTTLVYMSTPNLPLRYEIENTGTGGAAGFTHICSTVISEGGAQEIGFPISVHRGATPLVTLNNNSIYPLLSIRLNSSYLSSSVKVVDFFVNCTSTADYNFFLILNPTVVGTALSFTQITNSSIDAAAGSLNGTTVTGGTTLYSSSSSQGAGGQSLQGSLNNTFTLGSTIAGVSDVLVLAVQRLSGTTETFYGSLNVQDLQ